jgi:hypothetical protein
MFFHLFVQLTPFLLLTAGMSACGYVFLSLKQEIRTLTKRLSQQQQELASFRESLTAELENAKQRLREAEERTGVLVPPLPPKSGFNLSKRSQVMRMSRVGEKAEKIAAALSLPRKEVELLLKVQKIVLGSANASTS